MTVIWAARLMRKGKVFEYSSVLCIKVQKVMQTISFDFKMDKKHTQYETRPHIRR